MKSEPTAAFLFPLPASPGVAGEKSAPAPEKKLKVGFYVDDGSCNSGVFYWARLLYFSPQIEVTLVDGEDLRQGGLEGLDLLVVPGGSSARQCRSMGESGIESVRKFVKAGGSYVGVCAGFHSALNREKCIGLLPFRYLEDARGAAALLAVDISSRGAELMGIRPGRYMVRYSRGPIAESCEPWEYGKGEVLGVYKSSVGPLGKPGGNFFGAPAVIHGNYGKGKVIATSFHPESHPVNHAIALGCIRAVTGVKPVPVFPKKNYRPVRIAFYTPGTIGKAPIERMLELERHPDLDVRFCAGTELNEGILEHVDVFIVPDGIDAVNKDLADTWKEQLMNFMCKGGKILVSGDEAVSFPSHRNLKVIPAGTSFVEEALARP